MTEAAIEAIYPLSPMQQGMLFHSLYAPQSGVYLGQVCFALAGALDAAAFKRAWQHVIARHPILRTAFVWEAVDQPLQVVGCTVALPWEERDWRALPQAEQSARLDTLLAEDRRHDFDLSDAPLMRFWLIRTGAQLHEFVWSHHHLLLDGWSVPLVLQEVFDSYAAFAAGRAPTLAAVRPYHAYIDWLQRQDLTAAEAFWRQTLRGFSAPTPLGIDHAAASAEARPTHVRQQQFCITAASTAALQAFARQQRLTLSTLMQAAWALLLSCYSGERDVVFGITVAGRPPDLPGAESMVGLFINTLPLRVQLPPQASLAAWLVGLMEQQTDARQYEYSPLVQVQGWSDVPRGIPLFESILVFENFPLERGAADLAGGIAVQNVRITDQTNYPLTLVAVPGEALAIQISYTSPRFDDAAIRRMGAHLETILEHLPTDPARPLWSIPRLPEAERQQLLTSWNATQSDEQPTVCVQQLIEAQAAQTPDALAVRCADACLTYSQLDARANQLAHELRARGVGPEVPVGVCMERGLALIVGLLGVLKAGGAYVPIDPVTPQERIAFMLADTGAPVLLTQAGHPAAQSAHTARVICVEAEWEQIAQRPAERCDSTVCPANLAYIIYTSGSTGQPKGAMITHAGLVNYLTWGLQAYRVAEGGGAPVHSSVGFDLTVTSLYLPLLAGRSIDLIPDQQGIDGLATALRDSGPFSLVKITPAHLEVLSQQLSPADVAGRAGALVVGGEALRAEQLAFWRAHAPDTRIINEYGPTETVVGCCVYEVPPQDSAVGPVPIGRPIANTQLYLLDPALCLVPIGGVGELYIGGEGVARGYLGRPDLTAERFVPNPFVPPTGTPDFQHEEHEEHEEDEGYKEPGHAPAQRPAALAHQPAPQHHIAHSTSLTPPASSLRHGLTPQAARLYRTGDLARYRPDGNLEYLGRTDHQVKLHGFRIELGEIEAVLSTQPDVREAVVLAREDAPGDKRLVAYVTAARQAAGGAALAETLPALLRERLPVYMLPSAYIVLDALPLTPNGKLDRHALPAPLAQPGGPAGTGAPPRTPLEELLAGIWADVLGLAQVGRNDDFFALGGHSMRATQAVARIRDALQVELPLRALFEAPTVARLAAQLALMERGGAGELAPALTAAARVGELPLSFAQQRLWVLDRLLTNRASYNVPSAWRLRGTLDSAALEGSLHEIVRRHEVLRTSFPARGGAPIQLVGAPQDVPLEVHDLQHLPDERRLAHALQLAEQEGQRPFVLAEGPLMRAHLLRLADDDHMLLLTWHHIIFDGWSLQVFFHELAALYAAYQAGQPSPLPELPIQYADFAAWQRAWLQGAVLEAQLAYWRQRLGQAPALLELPTDRPRPAVQTFCGATHPLKLPAALTAALQQFSRRQNATMFMTLLAAFKVLLARYTQSDDIAIGTPTAGRRHTEVEGLIGCFVNTLVLRTDLSGNPTFTQLLERERAVALGAYAHQDVPFERLVEELEPERHLSYPPLFQVMFAFQAHTHAEIALPGLTLSGVAIDSGTAKFDLALDLQETDAGLVGELEYNTDLFDPATIARMASHYQALLVAIAADPDRSIAELPLLSDAERQHILSLATGPAQAIPPVQAVHLLVAAQAARAPHTLAVAAPDQRLTYGELDRRANQLAHHLRRCGVGPETLVGVCMDRSVALIVALLGVLKAGGAYLPLDPAYPDARLAWMLGDAHARVLLTQRALAQGRPALTGAGAAAAQPQVVYLDSDWAAIARGPTNAPATDLAVGNLAYVIYTSGSTGTPKGVQVSHGGLLNLIAWHQHACRLTLSDRTSQIAGLAFDAVVWEIWPTLAIGASLHLIDAQSRLVPTLLRDWLLNQRITVAFLPTPLAEQVLNLTWPANTALRVLNTGGDVLHQAPAQPLPFRLCNNYGPTENSVVSTAGEVSPAPTASQRPTLGRAIAGVQVYVLDARLQLAPPGVPGEVYIGGASLARGYLGRPDLTAERFVPNPFALPIRTPDMQHEAHEAHEAHEGEEGWQDQAAQHHAAPDHQPVTQNHAASSQASRLTPHASRLRLYRTGDQARYLPGGELAFLGRIDGQIKLRGYRIELGEIATLLAQHPLVAQSEVVLREDAPDEPRLVAYVVMLGGDHGQPAAPVAGLFTYLRERLPDYMVPSAIVVLDALPLTPNGKVDRHALPAPEASPATPGGYAAPRDVLELQLVQLWEEALGVTPIGITDNFFAIGGHSLLAVRLMDQIGQHFGHQLPLALLFGGATVEQLARSLRQAHSTGTPTSPLVAIQPHGDQQPLFLIHPGSGDVMRYFNLLPHLEEGRPLYGLQDPDIYGDSFPELPIEAMAARYIAAIRSLQPEGPYLLGGWSFGGIVAFEMAQQLQQQGQPIGLLAILDSGAPALVAREFAEHDTAYFLAIMAAESMRGKGAAHSLREYYQELRWLAPDEQLGYVQRVLLQAGLALPERGPLSLQHQLRVFMVRARTTKRYQASVYPGRISLFRSSEVEQLDRPGAARPARQPDDLGWGALSAVPLDLQLVPGYHDTLMSEPYIRTLATRLNACMRAVSREVGGSNSVGARQ